MHRRTVDMKLLIVVTFVAGGLSPREVQAALAHRYSFTTNASDSIGTAHGVVVDAGVPTAVFAGGKLDLSANTGEGSRFITEDAYVDLPNGLINTVALGGTPGAFSIEFWAAPSATHTWQRFVDFGTSNCGENDPCGGGNSPYIYITPNSGVFSQGLAAEAHAAGGAFDDVGQSGLFPNDVEVHIVGIYNHFDTSAGANGTFKLYRDGALLGAAAIPVGLDLANYTNNNNWLGRSQWDDPVFDGYFNELRLYDHVLTDVDVARNTLLGPNRLDSPLVYEGFDYSPPGADLLGSAGGHGFSVPWAPVVGSFANSNYDIGDGSLSFPGLTTSGNRVTTAALGSGFGGISRPLSTPLGEPGTTQYLSFLVRPEGTLNEGSSNGFFGLLLDGTTDLFVGKPGGGALDQFVLENNGGTLQHASGTTVQVDEEYILVLRADFTSGNDVFTLYVNPTPGGSEPTSGTIKNDINVGTVDKLRIFSTGAFSIDEIRIGPNFADVVPSLPGDYNQDGAVNAADYTVWRDNLGSATSLPNDDTAGVGPDDYTRWKTHFGESIGSGNGSAATGSASALATVPEPAAALLLALGLLVAPILRCRRSTSPNRRHSPTTDKKRQND